jgi:LacI family transcriptional regulator
MATIRDVAIRAGVSTSTVSRVVTGAVPVDPTTEARVREAISALGYRPNLLARSLRRRATHTIGLLVPDIANPFFADVARIIEDAGFEAGYSVILCNSDLSEEKQETYVDALLAKRVDGLILVSSGLVTEEDGYELVQRSRAAGVPCVVVDRDLGELPVDQVLVDNHVGGLQAAEHLIALGHRRIAMLTGPHVGTPSAGRIAGFEEALAAAGIELAAHATVSGDGRYEGGVAAAEELLAHEPDVTAVFVFNDLMAFGVVNALRRAGRRVPDDVSVVGFDDILIARAMDPPLTTVAQPVAELGRSSVDLLMKRMRHDEGPFNRIVLQTRLVERGSTAPAPVLA